MIRELRNKQRYEDYADKDWPYGQNVDYAEGRMRNQMYPEAQIRNEERSLFGAPGWAQIMRNEYRPV